MSRHLVLGSALAVLAATSGCSTAVVIQPRQQILLQHALFIENKGVPAKLLDARRHPLPPNDTSGSPYDFPPELFRTEVSPTLPRYVAGFGRRMSEIDSALEAQIRRTDSLHVVIVIHGGRNTLAASMDENLDVLKRMQAEDPSVYPIFIKYESEDLSSYVEHLTYTRPALRNQFEKVWRVARFPLTIVSDLATGVGRVPLNAYQEITTEWSAVRQPQLQFTSCLEDLALEHVQLPDRGQHPAVATARGLLAVPAVALRAPADVLLAAMGPGEWETMKRRSQVMLTLNQSYISALHAHRDESSCSVYGNAILGVVGMLVEVLARVSADHPAKVTVSVLAHSTGAIVACNMIHESRGRPIHWRNIVFMAAACTINDFDTKVRPALESPSGDCPPDATERHPVRFFNLCLHPTAELQEFSYPFAFFARGTLLVWIDNFLAPPGSFRDRTLGRAENALAYLCTLPAPIVQRSYLKVFDYGRDPHGCRTPMKHGAFMHPEMCFWRESFWMPEPRTTLQQHIADAPLLAPQEGRK
jgi:hypothetical protein